MHVNPKRCDDSKTELDIERLTDNSPGMGPLHFEQIDPHRNRARFYRAEILLTLFGEVLLVKGWGRVGSHGQQRELPMADVAEAVTALKAEAQKRLRRGYRPVDWGFEPPLLSGALWNGSKQASGYSALFVVQQSNS